MNPSLSARWRALSDAARCCRDAVPTLYKLEEQLITCVGLAPAKPGVFMAAVKHVLVVCTTVEVVLLGVCFSGDDTAAQARPCHHPRRRRCAAASHTIR